MTESDSRTLQFVSSGQSLLLSSRSKKWISTNGTVIPAEESPRRKRDVTVSVRSVEFPGRTVLKIIWKRGEGALMFEAYEDIMTVEEACEALRIGYNAIYDLLNSGKLKGYRNGRTWRIPKESIERFIREQTIGRK